MANIVDMVAIPTRIKNGPTMIILFTGVRTPATAALLGNRSRKKPIVIGKINL